MQKIKRFLIKYRFQMIFISIFIVSIISIYIQDKTRKESFEINSKNINNVGGKICVYISGEVKKEGIYFLDENSRIVNVIDLAGGLTENADISKVNPAQKVNDSDKIIIPQKQENKITEDSNNEDTDQSQINQKVNINTATKEELTTLNGIGESTANKIINYRKNNKFIEIEDIMNVSGIGEAKFNNIKDDICI